MSSIEFKAEVESLIQEKRKEIEALETTLRIITISKSNTSGQVAAPNLGGNGRSIDLDALNVSNRSKPTLKDRVAAAVMQIPVHKEFSVPQIEAVINNSGFKIPGKAPRGRIALMMKKLTDDGMVRKTVKSVGFKPSKYKRIENVA